MLCMSACLCVVVCNALSGVQPRVTPCTHTDVCTHVPRILHILTKPLAMMHVSCWRESLLFPAFLAVRLMAQVDRLELSPPSTVIEPLGSPVPPRAVIRTISLGLAGLAITPVGGDALR